jgi:hypothetical protein
MDGMKETNVAAEEPVAHGGRDRRVSTVGTAEKADGSTDEEVWYGGEYELAIELGPRDDERLDAALCAAWSHPAVEGICVRRDVEPKNQKRLDPSPVAWKRPHQFGVLNLPDGTRLACGTVTVRETRGIDWLDLYVPMGSLTLARPDVGAFPFEEAFPFEDRRPSRPWREPLDALPAEIGQRIWAAVPFRFALVGHEVLGQAYADNIEAQGRVPETRWDGYLYSGPVGENGAWAWYPPTLYDSQLTVEP